MRRAPFRLLAGAAASDANAAIMLPNHHPRRRGRGFFNRPYSGGRQEFVTGDEHFQSVQDVNSAFRRDGGGSFANQRRDRNPSFNPRPFPPYHRNQQFRHPSPYNHALQCRHPSPYNHAQQFRHPSHPPPYNGAQKVRPRPPDYRDWEYAAASPPPHCERFIILSYNVLADYLAIDHRSKLYSHIPPWMLDWQWRKRNIVFELGLWSPDIMCLQEVDRFDDLEEELKHQGYSGIWKMRTGNPVDGCAIFWRTSRFNLRYEECIEFSKLGLRDNVAQICVLELMNQDGFPPSSSTGSNKVVICNIHVLYNPNRGEIKLGQVRVLLDRAKAVSKIWDDAPVVICGDFNCTPKLNLSGIDRDKVSGQASAEIHKRWLKGPNSSERSANAFAQDTSVMGSKEVTIEQNICSSDLQKLDNQDNIVESQYNQIALNMSTKSSINVQSENGSSASYGEKVIQQTTLDNYMTINEVDGIKEESITSFNEGRLLADHINNDIQDITLMTSSAVSPDKAGMACAEQISDAVSSSYPELLSEKFNLDIPKGNKHTEFGNCSTSLGEDTQSFRVKTNPESSELPSAEISSTSLSSQMSISDSIETPHLTHEESPSFELTSDVPMSSTLPSYQADESRQSTDIDLPLEEKVEKLSFDEMDKDMLGHENSGEDIDAFTSALHTAQEGFLSSFGTDFEKSESTTYNPSLWTPTEIETATGNSDCTFLEHSLPLRSTYVEVMYCPGTRDPNGEPLVTSYHRRFLGTVDYIWRSDGLQTIRVLAPIPKRVMEFTPGFPTKKWGSDHIALVSELAVVKGVTNASGGGQ
ncbi:carbon catabolite repressor protein 4 homolog 6 isoform X2 [Prosopis cineraria]|uniref:carbon catabolite repressor protein 4 homolog 6 isoform X2 n=1 Tax=Prosopis cineraria TaxID=364024 RepID=UPI00240F6607|nr:carbon catabolite repressor protein 4 homolog 6 isoform X2 [Prosopis cineraria]